MPYAPGKIQHRYSSQIHICSHNQSKDRPAKARQMKSTKD